MPADRTPAVRSPDGWRPARLRGLWTAGTGLLWPVDCAGCGVPGESLCPVCGAGLVGPARQVTLTAWPQAPGAWAAGAYRDEARSMLVAWKERGRADLTPALGAALAVAVRGLLVTVGGAHSVVMVPVPSAASARRRRGQDGVRSLALVAARELRDAGTAVRVVPALRLGRRVADQAGLSTRERAVNLREAMRLRSGAGGLLAGRAVIIVDDVLTTGSTVREAARALRAGGGQVLGAAACFATPLGRGLSPGAHLD